MSGAPPDGDVPDHDLPDYDLDAAEYVMGLLAPEQARAVEALAMHDHAVSASITAWQTRLAPLALVVKPEFPPPELWQRLALASGLQKAPLRRPVRRKSLFEKMWFSPTLWRTTTAGALVVAAGLAFLVMTPKPPPPEPLVAALSPQGAPGVVFLVRVGERSQATVSLVGRATIPLNRVLELWALNDGATTPVSLGLLPNAGRVRLKAPVRAGTRLLVSQEPTGGSPTGLPTGPVVYAGLLAGT